MNRSSPLPLIITAMHGFSMNFSVSSFDQVVAEKLVLDQFGNDVFRSSSYSKSELEPSRR